jgi:cytochrome b6-f complex iron-sulfur subunit
MTVETTIEKKPMNRREFLNFAWLVSIGFFTFTTAGVSYLFALPRFREGEFGGEFPAGTIGDLPDTSAPPNNQPKVKLWLSNTDKGLLALYKVCTHLGCLYNWNTQEVKFICPCHGSQFQKDGTYIKGPAPRNLDRFVVRIQSPDGEILAETDPETGAPLPLPDDPNAQIIVDTGQRIQGERHA